MNMPQAINVRMCYLTEVWQAIEIGELNKIGECLCVSWEWDREKAEESWQSFDVEGLNIITNMFEYCARRAPNIDVLKCLVLE